MHYSMDKFGTIFDSKKINKFYSKVGTKNLALSPNNPVVLIIIVEYHTQYFVIFDCVKDLTKFCFSIIIHKLLAI